MLAVTPSRTPSLDWHWEVFSLWIYIEKNTARMQHYEDSATRDLYNSRLPSIGAKAAVETDKFFFY